MLFFIVSINRGRISAKSITEEARNPTDGGYADAGHVVYAAIGEISLQKTDYLPAINKRLKLRGRA